MNVLIFSAGSEPVKLNSIYLIVLPSLPSFSPPPHPHTLTVQNVLPLPRWGFMHKQVLLCTLGGLCGEFCRLKPKKKKKRLYVTF